MPFYKLKEFKNDKILRQMSQLVENKEDLLDAENVSLLCYLLRTKKFMLKSNIAEYPSCQRTSSWLGEFEERKLE